MSGRLFGWDVHRRTKMGRPCKCCGKTITEPSEPCGFCPCYDVDNPDIYEWVLAICFFDVVQINDDWDIYIGKYGDDQEDLSFIGSVSGTPVEGQDCRCFIFATSEDLYRQNGDDIVFEVSEECSNSNFCSVIENVNIVDSSLFEICDNVKIRFNRSNDNGNGSAFTFQLWRKGPIDYIDENGETQTKTGYCQLAYDVIGAPTFPGVHGYTIDKPIYQSCCPIYCQEKVCSCYNFDDPNFEDPNADPDCVGRYPAKVVSFSGSISRIPNSFRAYGFMYHYNKSSFPERYVPTPQNVSPFTKTIISQEIFIDGLGQLNQEIPILERIYRYPNGSHRYVGPNICPFFETYTWDNVRGPCKEDIYDFCSDPGCYLGLYLPKVSINGFWRQYYSVEDVRSGIVTERDYRVNFTGFASISIAPSLDPVNGSIYPMSSNQPLNFNISIPIALQFEDGGSNSFSIINLSEKCSFQNQLQEEANYLDSQLSNGQYPYNDNDYVRPFPQWWYRGGHIDFDPRYDPIGLRGSFFGYQCFPDYSLVASTPVYDCKKMRNIQFYQSCNGTSFEYNRSFQFTDWSVIYERSPMSCEINIERGF